MELIIFGAIMGASIFVSAQVFGRKVGRKYDLMVDAYIRRQDKFLEIAAQYETLKEQAELVPALRQNTLEIRDYYEEKVKDLETERDNAVNNLENVLNKGLILNDKKIEPIDYEISSRS